MNELFPVFLKLESLSTLIVGGGNVGLEKLTNLLRSSPQAKIRLIGITILPEIEALAKDHPGVRLIKRRFRWTDIINTDIAILATANRDTNIRIRRICKLRNILVNVADTPDLCDFYLGAVVTKGHLKVGISTNGRSPTMAKRFREMFEEVIPDETQEVLENMNKIRDQIKGDLKDKISTLNEVTRSWKGKE